MNNCEKYQEMISSMLDGELSDAQQSELSRHLSVCPRCRRMYSAFSALSSAAAEDTVPVPADLHESIMSAVRSSASAASRRGLIVRLRPYAAAAACLIVIAAGAICLRGGFASSANVSGAAAKFENSAPAMYAAADSAEQSSIAESSAQAPDSNGINSGIADIGDTKSDPASGDRNISSIAPQENADAELSGMQAPRTDDDTAALSELDVEECLLTTDTGSETVSEVLSAADTRIWIAGLFDKRIKYSENTDPSLIRYTMHITRAGGEEYTLYLHYDNGQLMCSRSTDDSDAAVLDTAARFVEYADGTGE